MTSDSRTQPTDADVLFGGTGAAPTPAVTDEAATISRQAHALTRDIYGEDYEIPNELYPPENVLREAFRARAEDVATVLGLSTTQQQARHREFASVARETGLDVSTVLAGLYDEYTNAELAAARETPTPEAAEATRRAWDEETRRVARATYGPHEAEDLLARTNAFIDRHPKLRTVVTRGGIRSNPKVLMPILEHVRRNFIR